MSGSIQGLSAQTTARQGNLLGILGVGSGILASLAAVGFPPAVLAQFAALSASGAIAGEHPHPQMITEGATLTSCTGGLIGRRISPTELPQTVAALHSVVGLAAVMTSIGSVMANIGHISTLHLVSGYLGVLIGMIFQAHIRLGEMVD